MNSNINQKKLADKRKDNFIFSKASRALQSQDTVKFARPEQKFSSIALGESSEEPQINISDKDSSVIESSLSDEKREAAIDKIKVGLLDPIDEINDES